MSAIMASSSASIKFPPRNDSVRGKWSAIYIEPMVGSGENICIAVAVVNQSGYLVVPVIALNRLECLYGKDAEAISSAADIVVNDLRTCIAKVGVDSLNVWEPPMDGVRLGAVREGAGESIEAIARTALMMSSSLVERLCEADEDFSASNERISGNRLEELIKERAIELIPNMVNMFGKQIRSAQNVRPVTIGFVGNVIAANFGVLTPQYLSANVKDIKSKLWDLANLREELMSESLMPASINRYEMLFYRPTDDAPEYSTRQITTLSEAVNELEAEADKRDIRCRENFKYESIVETLIEAEAA